MPNEIFKFAAPLYRAIKAALQGDHSLIPALTREETTAPCFWVKDRDGRSCFFYATELAIQGHPALFYRFCEMFDTISLLNFIKPDYFGKTPLWIACYGAAHSYENKSADPFNFILSKLWEELKILHFLIKVDDEKNALEMLAEHNFELFIKVLNSFPGKVLIEGELPKNREYLRIFIDEKNNREETESKQWLWARPFNDLNVSSTENPADPAGPAGPALTYRYVDQNHMTESSGNPGPSTGPSTPPPVYTRR